MASSMERQLGLPLTLEGYRARRKLASGRMEGELNGSSSSESPGWLDDGVMNSPKIFGGVAPERTLMAIQPNIYRKFASYEAIFAHQCIVSSCACEHGPALPKWT